LHLHGLQTLFALTLALLKESSHKSLPCVQLAEVHKQPEALSSGNEKLQGSLAELSAAQAGALEDIHETGKAVNPCQGFTQAARSFQIFLNATYDNMQL
jgi:hypothetical protein